MRKVLSLLACLFKFWTWKDLFLCWVRTWSLYSPNGDTTSAGLLPLVEVQQDSEYARFLTSLPEDHCWCWRVEFNNSALLLWFGPDEKLFYYRGGFSGAFQESYYEFLAEVASSRTMYREMVNIHFNWDDGVVEHVVGFVSALRQSGNNFKVISVVGTNGLAIQFAKCVSSVLGVCDGVEVLRLELLQDLERQIMRKEVAAEFMANIAMHNNLRICQSLEMVALGLDEEGMEEVMKPFMDPGSVLEDLTLNHVASDVQLEHVGAMLATSMTLERLALYPGQKKALTRGYASVGAALHNNRSLADLTCRICSSKELKAILDPLMPQQDSNQHNTTITKLCLMGSIGGQEGVELLAKMLLKNTSLLRFELWGLREFCCGDPHAVENVLTILKALKANTALKTISFPHSDAVGGSKVLGSMMDLLLENHCIEDIGLTGTPLEDSGDAEYVRSALSKRKKMRLWDVVRGMANVKPTLGRVFLCGEPYAGKTRLRTSVMQLLELQPKHQVKKSGRVWRRKLFKCGVEVKEPKEDSMLERTHSIEVSNIPCDGIGITIWDMAGQTDYHSFHKLVMPNLSADGSCSLFMLLCNPAEASSVSRTRMPSQIRAEIELWLRLIASNTRRSLSYRPHVCIVMTHFDWWKGDDLFDKCMEDMVVGLKVQFEEVLEFDEDKVVFKVDGRRESNACGVFDFMRCHLKELLGRLPKTIGACEEVQRRVAQWNAGNPGQALVKWDEFCEHMCEGVEGLEEGDADLVRRRKEFVATSLNDGGHIIYNEEGGMVVTNPHWFCHDIMGEFLHQCASRGHELEMVSANGMISMEHMKCLMLGLTKGQRAMEKSFGDILSMMKKLHVCYERDANAIMIPLMLEDKHHELRWWEGGKTRGFVHVGRRMACKDGRKTMLSAGFFARLQVSFFEKLHNPNDQGTYKLYQDVIRFLSDGMEVIVEYNRGDIDILLRSCRSQDEMLKFLDREIVRHIKHLQEDPVLGCLGVVLEEYVLRPTCVEKLTSSEHRKNQYVCAKDLEVEVARSGLDAIHNWKSCEGLDCGYDKVKSLLGGLAWTSLLERRALNLEKYGRRLTFLGGVVPNHRKCSEGIQTHDPSTSSIFGRFHERMFAPVFAKLDDMSGKGEVQHKEVMLKLDELKVMIESLERSIKSMEGNLLREVCAKMDKLMAISMEMQQSQIPKLAYLCEVGKKKLLTRLVPGLLKFELHLMCENMEGFHEVANQKGCLVRFATEQARKALAMVEWGLKVATILVKIGAHVAGGMGGMIPDWSDGGRIVALVLDTPGVLDGEVSLSSVECVPDGVKGLGKMTVDGGSEAQRWMMDLLEPMCASRRELHEKFELTKARYKSEGGAVAWICDGCRKKQSGSVEVL